MSQVHEEQIKRSNEALARYESYRHLAVDRKYKMIQYLHHHEGYSFTRLAHIDAYGDADPDMYQIRSICDGYSHEDIAKVDYKCDYCGHTGIIGRTVFQTLRPEKNFCRNACRKDWIKESCQ